MELEDMLVAELRYVGFWIACVGAMVVSAGLTLVITNAGHLSASASAGMLFIFLGAFGFAALTVWLRYRNGNKPATLARYGPLVVPAAILLVEAYWIATRIPDLQAAHWKHGVDSFGILCIMTGWLAVTTVRDWRSRWRSRYYHEVPAPVHSFTQKRMQQFSAAYELPTVAERRRALRPLLARGYIRLGLLGSGIVLMVVLTPQVGTFPAYLGSVVLVGSAFLILHKLFEL